MSGAERFFRPVVAALMVFMAAVMAISALGETQTWDEAIHIASGYAYLEYGDYGWNREHPPLVKMMSALPLLPLKPLLPALPEAWQLRDQAQVGKDFLYRNRVSADTVLFRARAPNILLTALGGLLVALWTRRHFGAAAGMLAAALYAFDPNLIAHGRYVTTDAPMAVFFFLACAAWTNYLLSGRPRDLLSASAVFGLALTVKFSAVLLVPVMAALYAVRWVERPGEFSLRRLAAAAGTLAAVSVVIVGMVYGNETLRAARGENPPLAESVNRETLTGEVLYRAGRFLHLPRHGYLAGLDEVATHNRGGHSSYLMGERSETGWWYYFPVVFAVKSTLAALAATLLLAGGLAWWLVRSRRFGFVWLAAVFPPVFYFAAATTSDINLGLRHILPVYPMLYIAAGALAARLPWRRGARLAALGLASLAAAECAWIHPDYLAFFNALSGGPGNGPRWLVDSNIDWGQDVKKLAKWLEAHGTRRVWINYFGAADLKYYGIDQANPPTAVEGPQAWEAIDGFAAASVTPLQGVYVPWNDLEPLRRLPVAAKVGYSIYVYDLRKRK